MRSSTRIVLWAGSCAALAGTALAADLTGPEINALLYGRSIWRRPQHRQVGRPARA